MDVLRSETTLKQPIVGGHQFSVVIDLRHFLEREMTVKVMDRILVVEAKHEERLDPAHGPVSRHFIHRYRLPPEIDPSSVQCTISSDGKLTVIANKTTAKEPLAERLIPLRRIKQNQT